MRTEPRDLDVVQRWFQAVITHPDGPHSGAQSQLAQDAIPLERGELEKVVTRSARLSAEERVQVYANAYYARLLECLGESFPVLRRSLGTEIFNRFAFGYLQQYPSQSYTLNLLGNHFPEYLEETRPRDVSPDDPEADWPSFLIDLARLERAVDQVFDGPGPERGRALQADDLRRVDPANWPDCRLRTVPGLTLLEFRYPVNEHFTRNLRAKDDEELPTPGPQTEYVAIFRRSYVVRRLELSHAQFVLLRSLQTGATLGKAIESAAEASGLAEVDDDALATSLQEWFQIWCANEVFEGIVDG